MKTYNTEDARKALAVILADAEQGIPSQLSRYNLPKAVVIGLAQWEEYQRLLVLLADRTEEGS